MARLAIHHPFSRLLVAAIVCFITVADVGAQGQPEAPADSYTFNQPVPVNIRKSNKAIVQMMLLGIDLNGIRVMSAQGKTMEFANNTFISASSLDGSFFYSPTKSNPAEVIQRLNKLQPARTTNQNPNVPGTGPGFPMPTAPGAATVPGVHNQIPPGTNPAISTFPNTTPTAHAQPPSYPQTNSAFPGSPMPTTTHAQTPSSTYPTTSPMPTSPMPTSPMPTSPMPTYPTASHSAMPGMAHNTMPSSPSPSPSTPMPTTPQMQSPAMPNMNMSPSMTTQNMYVCGKCKQINKVTGTLQAGHRCTHCGVVWDKVLDENGKVVSSSPAAAVGGAFGGVALIIGIVVAIVRKTQAS